MKRIDTVALTGRGRMMMEKAIEDGEVDNKFSMNVEGIWLS